MTLDDGRDPARVLYDVAIVGYGPTGMVLGALLGRAGHRVAIIERYDGLYNLPRAATFDDETMRLLQKLGLAAAVAPSIRVQPTYDWCNAAGEILIRNEFSEFGHSGWPEFNMMFQPELERHLDQLCESLPTVDIFRGHRVVAVDDDALGTRVTAERRDGTEATVTARYTVACDGGNSTVRSLLGAELFDYGFEEPWLVCDFEIEREVDLPLALQFGDPAQPTSIISLGPRHHRFSFMLGRAIASADDVSADDVWSWVSRWLQPDEGSLIRVAPYTFKSKIAVSWRYGRIFLAGDAAHQMPPFLGQGMCSGIRDAHNLAWKLSEVINGVTDDTLLDTYMAERSPHVHAITRKAVELGRVQAMRDPDAARRRDEEFLRRRQSGERPDAFRFPPYADGKLCATATSPARGELFPQHFVADAGQSLRFDDAVDGSWVVVAQSADMFAAISDDARAAAERTGARFVTVAADATASEHSALVDCTGSYAAWFDTHGCCAVVVRPDWRVFGSAQSSAALHELIREAFANSVEPSV